MKNVLVVGFVIAILGACTSCATSNGVSEDSEYVTITGLKFRKSGSISTDILWAGVRRNRGVNTFDPKFLPVLENEITARKVTEAFNEQIRKVAFEAAAKAGNDVGEGGASGSISSESGSTGTYHVFKLFDVNDYVSEINSEQNREGLELLMRYSDPRVISSIAIVFNRKSNSKIATAGNVSLKMKNPLNGNPEFMLKASSSGETVASLSDGTVFAYEYARLCWEKTEGVVNLVTIEVDRPGIDVDCPSGTTDDATSL